jgi:hypothetical protein
MANPYAGGEHEAIWDQGYSHGWYNPTDTDPAAPVGVGTQGATVFKEGALAGREEAAVHARQEAGGGTVTIPEVTVQGDPNGKYDPNSADDAYADGYNAGLSGGGPEDSSGFADSVKDWYHKGWNEGYAARLVPAHEHSAAGEIAHGVGEIAVPTVLDHVVLHGLLKGAPWSHLIAMAISPGGDTPLATQLVYFPVCHLSGHNLTGDTIFEGGAWHGTMTTDDSLAASEGKEHESAWGHADATHVWSFNRDTEAFEMET